MPRLLVAVLPLLLLFVACSGSGDVVPADVAVYAAEVESLLNDYDRALIRASLSRSDIGASTGDGSDTCAEREALLAAETHVLAGRSDAAGLLAAGLRSLSPPVPLVSAHASLLAAANDEWAFWSAAHRSALELPARAPCQLVRFTTLPDVVERRARFVTALWDLRLDLIELGAPIEVDLRFDG